MEATLEFEMLKDTSVAEMIAEGATKELDDILDEVVNLAETMKAEKLIVDNQWSQTEKRPLTKLISLCRQVITWN